jgi:diguanylate cyclase (GGDEF)-like protein
MRDIALPRSLRLFTADLPTIYLVITVIGLTMTLVVAVTSWVDRDSGLAPIALGVGLCTLGYFLYGLRPVFAGPLFNASSNLALSASISCFIYGILRFQQRPALGWLICLPPLLVALVTATLPDQVALRVGLLSLLFTLQSAYLLKVVLERRRVTVGIGQYYLLFSFSLTFMIFFGRLLVSLFGPAQTLQVNQAGPLATLSLLTPVISLTLITLGFIIMGKERAEERNRRLAMQDELTGLANRRHVLDVLAQQLAAVTRANLPLSVLMMDVDHFKQINDRYGHPAGDEALRRVADCLRERVRAQDIAGRVGGEEFLVVLPQTSLEGALKLAESLREGMARLEVLSPDGRSFALTMSIGVSTLEDMPDAQGKSLIAAADAALYLAKQRGRNRVEYQAPGKTIEAGA